MIIYPRYIRNRSFRTGFTLAELLIALAILGVIAAFTIPKVLFTQQEQQKKAIFKEIIGHMEGIGYNSINSNEVDSTGIQFHQLLHSKFNYVTLTSISSTRDVYTLGNGAVIGTIQGNCAPGGYLELFAIDYNGLNQGTNTPGDDTFCGRIRFGNVGGCLISDARGIAPYGKMYVSPNCSKADDSSWSSGWGGDAMYQQIFSN